MTRKNVASVFVAILSLSFVTTATAQIVLTEVDILGGQIELTNLGATSAATGLLEWCLLPNYGVLESSGAAFAPGESRVYSIGTAMTINADAMWVYENKSGGFGNENFVSSGVVFGNAVVGGQRIAAVVADNGGSVWGSVSDFVDTTGITAGDGQSIQLNYPGTSRNGSADWTIAPSTLGSFVPEPSSAGILMLGLLSIAGIGRRRR